MKRLARFQHLLAIAALASASACQEHEPASPSPAAAPAAAELDSPAGAPSPVDQWRGKWNGPEGTFLELSKTSAGYRITLQNLDGPTHYDARAVGDTLEFTRAGKTETVRSGSGVDTGMKWLADKKDCLVIQAGEGFCRD